MKIRYLLVLLLAMLVANQASAHAGHEHGNGQGTTEFSLDSTAFFAGNADNNLDIKLFSGADNITGNASNGNIPTGWNVLVDGSTSGYATDLFVIDEVVEGSGTFSILNSHVWQDYANIAIGLKAANSYAIFELDKFASSGVWSTNPARGLSHYMVYGIVTETTNPVPVPGAFWLLATGLVGLFGLGRKKQSVSI